MIKFPLLVLCLMGQTLAASKLHCYQCPSATVECKVSEATDVECKAGDSPMCARWIKKGTTDETKAIRKCVIPIGAEKRVECPSGLTCTNCDGDLCNAASAPKTVWLGMAALVAAILYIH